MTADDPAVIEAHELRCLRCSRGLQPALVEFSRTARERGLKPATTFEAHTATCQIAGGHRPPLQSSSPALVLRLTGTSERWVRPVFGQYVGARLVVESTA